MLEFSIKRSIFGKKSNYIYQLFDVLRNIDQIATMIEIGFDMCAFLADKYINIIVSGSEQLQYIGY